MRYWREPQKTWMLNMLLALHLVRPSFVTDTLVKYFNERRFAVLLVDARGSGASGGHRALEFSPAEGTPRWAVYREAQSAAFLELPTKHYGNSAR
jgi:predicted acyl esterase